MATKRNDDPFAALERVRRLIQTEGAEAAARALISVAQNESAPAPARSTAGTSLLRAAGLFEKQEDAARKQLHEMTADELQAHIVNLERLTADAEIAASEVEDGDGDAGVFG